MTVNPITQTIRHTLVSNGAGEAAWSQLPEQITDALTGAYVLTPRPVEPRIDIHIRDGRLALTANGQPLTSPSRNDFNPETWRDLIASQESVIERALSRLTEYRAVLAYVEARAAEQDTKQQMTDKIRHEQRHEAIQRILPEAAAANNLPAWDDLDLLTQRSVDHLVDLTNILNGRTPDKAERGIKLHGTDPAVYL